MKVLFKRLFIVYTENILGVSSLILSLAFLVFPALVQGAEIVHTDAFNAIKSQDWQAAELLLVPDFKEHKLGPEGLYNYAIVQANLGHLGLALACLREAQDKRLFYYSAWSMENDLKLKAQQPKATLFEFLLRNLPMNLIIFFQAIYMVIIGVRAWRQKRLPWMGIVANGIVALFVFVFHQGWAGKSGTNIAEYEALSYSDVNAAPLAHYLEGERVRILQVKDQWVQVKGNGRPAGWVPVEKIYVHTRGYQ